jgi:hypothetical protein
MGHCGRSQGMTGFTLDQPRKGPRLGFGPNSPPITEGRPSTLAAFQIYSSAVVKLPG